MTILHRTKMAAVVALALAASACQTANTATTNVDPATLTGSDKAKAFDPIIRKEARKHGVPVDLAHAVVRIESNYNAKARGRAGEIGLMQIKPQTARGEGFRGSTRALYDPQTNIKYGMRYLAGAHQRADGDICGTILRYNAGHYAKRMNPISRRYCAKVKQILARAG